MESSTHPPPFPVFPMMSLIGGKDFGRTAIRCHPPVLKLDASMFFGIPPPCRHGSLRPLSHKETPGFFGHGAGLVGCFQPADCRLALGHDPREENTPGVQDFN